MTASADDDYIVLDTVCANERWIRTDRPRVASSVGASRLSSSDQELLTYLAR